MDGKELTGVATLESAALLGKVLKEKQLEAISSFVEGRDTFVALPTGYGKSLIYGITPSTLESVAILYGSRGGRYAIKGIKDYMVNDVVCRRKTLFSDFLKYHENDSKVTGCKCCDICLKSLYIF